MTNNLWSGILMSCIVFNSWLLVEIINSFIKGAGLDGLSFCLFLVGLTLFFYVGKKNGGIRF
ncbi:hypothetical protein SLH52_10745 [Cytobacillus sp. IB215665]|nr:hypothetical protein [Cytobacillus sp. IB215665]